ncbi:MAG TPA: HTH domain-containing protein [Candidatus Sulfotelmatobacter sp.]|nr:HTH domain-containing protein [Candidatus Sulfotelmatobacter sp.]
MADEFKDSTQPYAAMVAELKARRERLMIEAQKLEAAVVALEALTGAVDYVPGTTEQASGSPSLDPMIRVGEFHGLGIPNAARMILEKTNRHPLTTQDILRLLEKSGRKIEAKNPTGNIYSSLKRNPDFTLVAPNTWGLTDWYPGAKRKAPKPTVAAKVEEIMKRGTISLAEATQLAEREIAAEHETADEPDEAIAQ